MKDNLLPAGENRIYEVESCVTVDEVIGNSFSRIGVFNKFHILGL